jgi:thioesterase domain-containing protein
MMSNLEVAHQQATRTYVAKPYAGKLVLFRTAGQKEIWRPDPRLGWDGLAAGGVQVHYIAGDHATLLAEPHVRTLAEKLRECLMELGKNSPRNGHRKGEP